MLSPTRQRAVLGGHGVPSTNIILHHHETDHGLRQLRSMSAMLCCSTVNAAEQSFQQLSMQGIPN